MGAITRGIANNILGNGAVDGTDALTGTIPATNIGNPSLANLTTFPPSVDAGIPQVAGDPPAPSEGDVWYNTNTYKLKVRGLGADVWSTGGTLNTGRYSLSGTGTQTAAIVAGGSNPGNVGVVETYDGTSWTEITDLNTARNTTSQGPASTQTATIVWGGYPSYPGSYRTETELWNGSAWTELNDLTYGQSNGGAAGTSTSAIFGSGTIQTGNPYSGDYSLLSQSWNGTSWLTESDVNNARYGMNSSGAGADNTSALIFGGLSGPGTYVARAFTESWNGTSWTEVGDLNTARPSLSGVGATVTAALAYGGNVPPGNNFKTETESWNGTSWTETTDLNTSILNHASGGTASSALSVGGGVSGDVRNATEEFTAGIVENLDVDLA